MRLTVVCFTGAGFLLQAEGPWLTDEKRARSFGNHPTEPAVDGQKPAYTPKKALTLFCWLSKWSLWKWGWEGDSFTHDVSRVSNMSDRVSPLLQVRVQFKGCSLPWWTEHLVLSDVFAISGWLTWECTHTHTHTKTPQTLLTKLVLCISYWNLTSEQTIMINTLLWLSLWSDSHI